MAAKSTPARKPRPKPAAPPAAAKPRPNIRHWGAELAVVVLGVLIALGAQQAADWVHRRSEVRQTREALRDEMAANLRKAAMNARADACTDRYMERYHAWSEGGAEPEVPSRSYATLNRTVWDIAKTGAVADMPLRERLAFARYYALAEDYDRMILAERDYVSVVGELHALDRLDAAEVKLLKKTMNILDSVTDVLTDEAAALVGLAREAGIEAAPLTAADRQEIAADFPEGYCPADK